jgi:hypothetical protein
MSVIEFIVHLLMEDIEIFIANIKTFLLRATSGGGLSFPNVGVSLQEMSFANRLNSRRLDVTLETVRKDLGFLSICVFYPPSLIPMAINSPETA